MVAVWVFVADAPHLVDDLGLGGIRPEGRLGCALWLELDRCIEVLARQQQHLLMESADDWNFGLLWILFFLWLLSRHDIVFGDNCIWLAVHDLRVPRLIRSFGLQDVLLIVYVMSCDLGMESLVRAQL